MTPEQLFEENIKLATYFSAKFIGLGEKDEVLQLGRIGLYHAALKYDSSLGVKFSTYAYHHIKNMIIKHFEKDNPIKISKHVAETMNYIRKHDLRECTVDEIAAKIPRLHRNTVKHAVELLDMPVSSLDRVISSEHSVSEMYDVVPGSSSEDWGFILQFKDFFSTLPEHEQKVVTMTLEGHVQTEIGEVLGVTQNSISRYLRRVRAKYEDYMREEALV